MSLLFGRDIFSDVEVASCVLRRLLSALSFLLSWDESSEGRRRRRGTKREERERGSGWRSGKQWFPTGELWDSSDRAITFDVRKEGKFSI